MEFIVFGYDGTDHGALDRRMAARTAHLEVVSSLKAAGMFLYGGAMLDDEGNMTGSVMVLDFPSEDDLREKWLNDEPFVIGNVWRKVEVRRFRPVDLSKI